MPSTSPAASAFYHMKTPGGCSAPCSPTRKRLGAGPKRHFAHSKVMAWVAVDRMIACAERFGLEGPVARWRRLRDAIHSEVCNQGFAARQQTFVQHYGGTALAASLLMIPLLGFLPPVDARVQGTVEMIQRHLMAGGL